MKTQSIIGIGVALLALLGGARAGAATIDLTGTIRDFHYAGTSDAPLAGQLDFENAVADDRGIVETALGADGTPVYAHGTASTATVHGAAGFDQWFHDTPGVNLSELYTITLNETSPGSGIYSYDNPDFFPIDNQLGGNQGSYHNYSFTYQIHSTFTYELGQTFDFSGDDDVWVFINDSLVIDLGGVHSTESASVNLDTLGLAVGGTYDFDFFFAERHTSGSDMKITTSIPLVSHVPTVPDSASTLALLAGAGVALMAFRRPRGASAPIAG